MKVTATAVSQTPDSVLPDECQPQLVHIMGGVGAVFPAGSPDTFISPVGENAPLNSFTFEATQDVALISVDSVYTGPINGGRRRGPGLATAPEVAAFISHGGGIHTIELAPAPSPGEWLKLTLTVRSPSQNLRVIRIWLAHHPGDINQDGVVDIRDGTAFGELFRTGGPDELIDLNGDGRIDVRDATTFGQIWRGEGVNTRAWQGSTLPPKPE